MIGVGLLTYDPAGSFFIDARIKNAYEGARRGSVTATLDGGASVYDSGYSPADHTMTATVVHPALVLLEQLRYVVAHYPQIILGCEAGCYRVVPSFALAGETLNLRFRVVERYAQE